MRGMLFVLLFGGLLLFAGCTRTQYVCPDGTSVLDPASCAPSSSSCQGSGSNYCGDDIYYYNSRCVNGNWQYSQEVCDYSCSTSGCVERPATDFTITQVKYECLAKIYPPSGGGIYIVRKNIAGLEESSAYGGITDIRLAPSSGASLPSGIWNLSVEVRKADNTNYFESSGQFGSNFISSGGVDYSFFDVSDFVSAPYTKGGHIELTITSPEGITKQETIGMPTEGCDVSTFSASELLDMVGEELTKSKIFRNYDVNETGCVGLDYPEIKITTTDHMDGNPEGSCEYAYPYTLISTNCVEYYKPYDTWSCAKFGGVHIDTYYYNTLAPPFDTVSNELESRAAGDSTIHYSTIGGNIIELDHFYSENTRIFWIFCKNKAWVRVDATFGDAADLNDGAKIEQAVRNISDACENS